jgi:hypothetical protein
MHPDAGIFPGVTALMYGVSKIGRSSDFTVILFKETTKEVSSCKIDANLPKNAESDSHRVEVTEVRPKRLARDRSNGDNPAAGTITVAHPDRGHVAPMGLKPKATSAFEAAYETAAASCSEVNPVETTSCVSTDIPAAVLSNMLESEIHRVSSSALEVNLIFQDCSDIAKSNPISRMKALPVRGIELKVSFDERSSECMCASLKYVQVLSMETTNFKDWSYLLADSLATMLDSEIQTLDSDPVSSIFATGDGFRPPKSNPMMVKSDADVEGIDIIPGAGDFGGWMCEIFATSYEMKLTKHCLRRWTLICKIEEPGKDGGVRHFSTESAIQTWFRHCCESIATDPLYIALPKLAPSMVSIVAPVTG